jgi:hypothetical protein
MHGITFLVLTDLVFRKLYSVWSLFQTLQSLFGLNHLGKNKSKYMSLAFKNFKFIKM